MSEPLDLPSRARPARWLALLALVPLLSGCAAIVAVPFVAGSMLFARDQVRVRAATKVPRGAIEALPAPRVTITNLTELPPPSGAPAPVADDRWKRFFDYALTALTPPDQKLQSALLASPEELDASRRLPCKAAHPAVLIDLDQGPAPFAPDNPPPAPPELVAGLARLREAGFTVLWISRLPSARVAEVARALRSSGLDPQGMDQLLLVRNAEDRKQVLRQQANEDVCILAIAGDQRADFDELFEYLRNPASGVGLYPLMEGGWFLVPFPGEVAASER
jgi:hypothetical protein